MNWKTTTIAAGLAAGLLGVSAWAHGPQGSPGGYGMGSGMMGGPGMMGAPGMMGGYGMGPGMMGGGMMGGPGMMGPGMHGWSRPGYGMGPGMMGGVGPFGGIRQLELTDAQRTQLRTIEDDLRRKNWNLMGQMQDEMAKAHDGWSAKRPDRSTLLSANKRMFELRQQMLENRLDAQDRAEGLLTPQQKEQYETFASSAWGGQGAR